MDSIADLCQRFLKVAPFCWPKLITFPLSCNIPLFSFYLLPSIPKRAAIPRVNGCCLTVPDLWNDDGGAGGPHPSVFISVFRPPSPPCPHPPTPKVCHTVLWLWSLRRWQMFLVAQFWTPILPENPPRPYFDLLAWSPWHGISRSEVRKRRQQTLFGAEDLHSPPFSSSDLKLSP